MVTAALPTRWIACVDGTWCTPDGPYGTRHRNISNTYRICASIKTGVCLDQTSGVRYIQKKIYYNGIGSEEDIDRLRRLEMGVFGVGYQDQIRQVYEGCCTFGIHPDDEIWLFGFSRGAYVVRAVASLLHHLMALTSAGTPAFEKHYREALKIYRGMRKTSKLHQAGQIHHYIAANTRKAPKIKFVGVFDTVAAVNDQSLYDISFNDSIQHLRHALALNENREVMRPEYLFPDYHNILRRERSLVQAWFIGAHIDIGGSAAKDGLALYPLQWMFIESRSKGLVLQFDGSFNNRANIDNPLNVALPTNEMPGEGGTVWSSEIKNGCRIEMQDLAKIHDGGQYGTRYNVHLNQSHNIWLRKKDRQPFTKSGELEGYVEFAPHGTILHPSVYMIFDRYCHVFLDSKDLPFRSNIEKWRDITLSNDGFWNDREMLKIEEPEAIRILVCGNTGVGKSTLINEVFGVEVTSASNRKRGIHNIRDPITYLESKSNLIVHDSGGFETGGTEELQKVKEFVTDLSNKADIKDRLHVIWFCIETKSDRTGQVATTELFKILSETAREIPIMIIATKKDEYHDLQYMKAKRDPAIFEDPELYADKELQNRVALIKKELLDIENGRCDDIVPVSYDDKESIRTLTEVTSRCFDHEKVRMQFVAAQVTRIDLKVDLAIIEAMRVYKNAVTSAATIACIPTASSTNRVTVAVVVCKAIVACFGVPGVSAKAIQEIVKCEVWDDMGHNVNVFFAESIAVVGAVGTLIFGGAPLFLAASAINIPFVVPATARLVLMLACDMILILSRAYKDCIDRSVRQPLTQDIDRAAIAYRRISKVVHREIKDLIPQTNVIKTFRAAKILVEFREIVEKFKVQFTEGIGKGLNLQVSYPTDKNRSQSSSVAAQENKRLLDSPP